MAKINRYNYEIIYALNKITGKWLEEVNKDIKERGIDEVISCNDDRNIDTYDRAARAKYAPEVEAEIQKIKDANTPINAGATDKCVTVAHLGKSTQDKIDKICDLLEEQQENKVIQRVANMIKCSKVKGVR